MPSTPVVDKSDQIVGCILGGAIGDCMGGPYEGQCGPVEIVDAAEWRMSDDTQLTLATCESYANLRSVDPADIASRMVSWFQAGRLSGLGASTLKALKDLSLGAHWALSGSRGEMSAGNGAAMRVAPLAFVINTATQVGRTTLRDVCRITHHHDEAYVGALAVVQAVKLVTTADWTPDASSLPALVSSSLPDSRVRDRLEQLSCLDSDRPVFVVGSEFGTSGYVVDSVPLAIFAAQQVTSRGFLETVTAAIRAGGDTDTIGSMAGQIAGACKGANGLELADGELPDRSAVLAGATRYAQAVTQAT